MEAYAPKRAGPWRRPEAGYSAIEIMAPAHFKTIVRDVRDDPWERIRQASRLITKTPLAVMQQCSITGFGIVPQCLVKLWMERLAANGVRRLHLMEASNDYSLRVPDYIKFAKAAGIEVNLALIYSISPKHTEAYYATKAAEAAASGADSVFLKDPGGLLTPERTRALVPVILSHIGDSPIEFHSHCTTGLAPLCYLEAARLGIRTLHTAIPPLANGAGQPSVFNIASNLRHLGFEPHMDESPLAAVTDHFEFIARREGRPIGSPLEYDHYQYIHQIPGGVISNLRRQLAQLKLLDRLPQVIDECIRVRKDFGYPIMVTPFSQFVATQASINVVVGERYKQVVDDLIYYALGFWGQDAASSIDPEVMDTIMSLPRTKELRDWEPPEPSLDQVRAQFGGTGLSDDELLLRYIIGSDEDIRMMRGVGLDAKPQYTSPGSPLVTLISEALKVSGTRYFSVNTKGIHIEVGH